MGPEAAYPVHSNANIHSEGSADGDAKADKAADAVADVAGDVDSELEPGQQVRGIKSWGHDGASHHNLMEQKRKQCNPNQHGHCIIGVGWAHQALIQLGMGLGLMGQEDGKYDRTSQNGSHSPASKAMRVPAARTTLRCAPRTTRAYCRKQFISGP